MTRPGARRHGPRDASAASPSRATRRHACAYKADDGADRMTLNLIDTPGHVDFYVRGLAAAWPRAKARCWSWTPAQGIEAQTLANLLSGAGARPGDHARPEQDRPAQRRRPTRGEGGRGRHRLPCTEDILRVSAKTGRGRRGGARSVSSATSPRPTGDPERTAASADLRLRVRPATSGVIVYVPRLRRPAHARAMHVRSDAAPARSVRRSCEVGVHGRYEPEPLRRARGRRGRLYLTAGIKTVSDIPRRRHRSRSR